ncbi:unnamed protein product, partial [Symbiodinium necroappetens]
GGLHAKGGYQQEAGSSVLFENCLADSGALAVEDADECCDGGGAHLWWNFTQGPNSSAIFRSCRAGQHGCLLAMSDYRQEAGSSVLFENCSTKGTLAVEDVDEGFCVRVSSPQ